MSLSPIQSTTMLGEPTNNNHRYLVWIVIEEVDADGQHVTDHDLDFASEAQFDHLDPATIYANRLHMFNQDARYVKSPDGRDLWIVER